MKSLVSITDFAQNFWTLGWECGWKWAVKRLRGVRWRRPVVPRSLAVDVLNSGSFISTLSPSRHCFSRAFLSPSCQGVFWSNIFHIFVEAPLPHRSLEHLIFCCISLQLLVWYRRDLKKLQGLEEISVCSSVHTHRATWLCLCHVTCKVPLRRHLQKFNLNNNCPVSHLY